MASLLANYASDSDDDKSNVGGPSRPAERMPQSPTSCSDGVNADQNDEEEEDDDDDDEPFDPTNFGLKRVVPVAAGPGASDAHIGESRNGRKSKRRKGNEDGSGSVTWPAAGPSGSSSNALIVAAPDVEPEADDPSTEMLLRPTDTVMNVNLPYEAMTAPILGPSNPYSTRKLGAQQNTLGGHVEQAHISEFDFANQQRSFDTLGYAYDPSTIHAGTGALVGDAQKAAARNVALAFDHNSGLPNTVLRNRTKEMKAKRQARQGDPSVVEGDGAYVGPWGGWEGENVHVPDGVGPSEEELKAAEERKAQRQSEKEKSKEKREKQEQIGTEKSIFHGKSMYDYQGRTYMHIPTDVDTNLLGEAGTQTCYLPKGCLHEFKGHNKGISAIRLFPQSGHLMLSASMDTKVKLWDIYHEGNCLRTFMGHNNAVRDITFSNDGRRFLSAGYDRQVKLWDTETGACLKAFSNGKIPYCIKFHPDEDKQHIFLAGMSDKKIVQWDTKSKEITQEYDQHLGPVNSITFVDENRRFVTTSDDKTMRAWDFDIPVVIKYIADPTMYSMPSVTLSPNKKWLGCQSLDNQVLIYAADSFRQNRKKIFKGHNVAGFACQVGFSPDGRFVSSGDSEGNLVFWDWKSGRTLKRIRAHREVVITHEWLPHETSKVLTGSWDGLIKLWE
ncbi:WD40 repeat-like protein [Tilletiaria anomala UBC 951]|uniref:Pre-mRNA-processing factor 17 n=1 Tax=Tilletiaria anomala (strain ATCC 24038 / CBS 436.72 / UBC 951) TaxID=1037660 RepID=A0A066V875_TILAU|nr:WD40 repeat-like protein [Tilletiaria anomala UBC 951]KDN37917.1 WD40 repeat-like protein [Tilletiaria anomala UBC 951]